MSSDDNLWQGLRLIARYHGTAVNIRALREQFFVDAEHHPATGTCGPPLWLSLSLLSPPARYLALTSAGAGSFTRSGI